MPVITYEGTVENGQIRLQEGVTLPERAKVYVVVPESNGPKRVPRPRLVHPEQAVDFKKKVLKSNA
jgi:hypothetical protein